MVLATQQSRQSIEPWVFRELDLALLGDARFTARALRLASDLAAHPGLSLSSLYESDWAGLLWMTYQVRIDPDQSPTVAFSPDENGVVERLATTQKPASRGSKPCGGDIASCSCSVGGTGCEKPHHKIVDRPWPVAFRDGVLACPKSHFLSPNDPDTGRLLSRNLLTASHVSGLLAPIEERRRIHFPRKTGVDIGVNRNKRRFPWKHGHIPSLIRVEDTFFEKESLNPHHQACPSNY